MVTENSARILGSTDEGAFMFEWQSESDEGQVIFYDETFGSINKVVRLPDGGRVMHFGYSSIVRFAHNGQLIWRVGIGIKQNITPYTEYGISSWVMYVVDNTCHIVMNDHGKNMGQLWSKRELEAYYPSLSKKIVSALISFNMDDPSEGVREKMWGADEPGWYFNPGHSNRNAQFGNRLYTLIMGKKRKTERIIRINLE